MFPTVNVVLVLRGHDVLYKEMNIQPFRHRNDGIDVRNAVTDQFVNLFQHFTFDPANAMLVKPFNRRCRPYSFFTFLLTYHISAFKPVKDKK